MRPDELIEMAKNAREHAYAPYSGFCVGAALLTKTGKVYTGCNIENSSYSPTICAERVAFSKAISDGEKEFSGIAIVGGKTNVDEICYPCGVCRQFISEFCDGGFRFYLLNRGSLVTYSLDELMPNRFELC